MTSVSVRPSMSTLGEKLPSPKCPRSTHVNPRPYLQVAGGGRQGGGAVGYVWGGRRVGGWGGAGGVAVGGVPQPSLSKRRKSVSRIAKVSSSCVQNSLWHQHGSHTIIVALILDGELR